MPDPEFPSKALRRLLMAFAQGYNEAAPSREAAKQLTQSLLGIVLRKFGERDACPRQIFVGNSNELLSGVECYKGGCGRFGALRGDSDPSSIHLRKCCMQIGERTRDRIVQICFLNCPLRQI
jgi:hypothetical protein